MALNTRCRVSVFLIGVLLMSQVPRGCLACGGTIHSGTGQISTPDYPDAYPGYLDCTWYIQPASNCVTTLYNSFLSLESGDFLTITNAGSSPMYTGSSLSSNYIYLMGSVTMVFTTDDLTANHGFRFEYSIACPPDVDECTTGFHACPAGAPCVNQPGSYTCTCDSGYSWTGSACADIDECATGANTCHTDAYCTNMLGAYTCTCLTGYNGNGVSCIVIDSCVTEANNCHTDASCTNTADAFTCACLTGYSGNGVSCTDIDECDTQADNCHTDASCTNTAGAFTCACLTGYNGNGVSCTDVDECTLGTDTCSTDSLCTNTDGSFTCFCNAGYTGDGTDCKIIYEIEIKPRNQNKISAKVLKDENTNTCISLNSKHFNFYTMKVDISTYALEAVTTFYLKITSKATTGISQSDWLSAFVSTSGLRPLYHQASTSSTEIMRACGYQSVTDTHVIVTCGCAQPCSVFLYFTLRAVQNLVICEVELMKVL